MKIVGCDLHTRYQQVAMLDEETGKLVERRLEHESGEARAFYAGLDGPVRVGIEATGHTRWFERMLAELGHELWMGDAAEIRASTFQAARTGSFAFGRRTRSPGRFAYFQPRRKSGRRHPGGLGRGDQKAHRRPRFWQGEDHSLDGSPPAQSREASPCPLEK